MEASVASTINIHITENHLSNQRQWAYRKGHSTELMLIKMTEDWRRALADHQVVGVVFVDFKKAFDSISHLVLLHKLQGLGISGDLWSWIADYLTDRTQVTVINGCQSNLESIKYGVPQGSVLGPILFSLFCNDLPNICENEDGEIFMYADDTTIYAIGKNHDVVCTALSKILCKLYDWCCDNQLTPHPGKSEFMILSRSNFTGPLQAIKLGKACLKQVEKARCLGVEIDDKLKWKSHVNGLIKSYAQKLNLLKSLHFLPTQARTDFCYKVILPSVTYGLTIWGSCGSTLFGELERIHVRAAKVIYGLNWQMPTEVYAKTKWRTLEAIYTDRLLALAHKGYYCHLPKPLQHFLEKYSSKYNLRRKRIVLLPKPKTDYLKKSIFYQVGLLWNSLNNDTRAIDNLNRFKSELRKNV